MPGKTTQSQTLGKAERLSRTKLIEELYEKGAVIKTPAIILVHRNMKLPTSFPAQVTFSVGKRNFRHSHDRNRIKRLMREVYRTHKQAHYAALQNAGMQAALMFIFTGRQLPEHDYVKDKITFLLERFSKLISIKDNESQLKNEKKDI